VEKSDCAQIGRVIKTFGYKGEFIAQIGKEFIEILLHEGSVFIETDEELVPYFIEFCESGDKDLYTLKFEDIDDVGQAKEFSTSILWFPVSKLPEEIKDNIILLDIKGFLVIDEHYGELGLAEEIIEMPKQSILRILRGKKEILLPVNEQFILETDRDKKQIRICAPEGLIESYLG
jgi:16S rRNA processing protein RimM